MADEYVLPSDFIRAFDNCNCALQSQYGMVQLKHIGFRSSSCRAAVVLCCNGVVLQRCCAAACGCNSYTRSCISSA